MTQTRLTFCGRPTHGAGGGECAQGSGLALASAGRVKGCTGRQGCTGRRPRSSRVMRRGPSHAAGPVGLVFRPRACAAGPVGSWARLLEERALPVHCAVLRWAVAAYVPGTRGGGIVLGLSRVSRGSGPP
jgi:hypothetical protein